MTLLDTELKQQLVKTLVPLFGQEPTFISDSTAIVTWLRALGCNALGFKEARNVSAEELQQVVVLATNNATIPHYKEWNALFQHSRLLVMPLVSFDPAMETVLYNMELLCHSTFDQATRLNEQWVQRLLDHKDPFIFRGEGCEFVCKVEEDVSIMLPKVEVEIVPGEWVSVGNYFEVGMIPQPDDIRPAFSVNGTFTVPGVAVAHHRQMHENLLPLVDRAWALFEELRRADAFPLQLHIENSRVLHVFASGKDIAEELEYLTNKRRERVLTEMAFSTNGGVLPQNVDWSKNSQLNEGAIGIHVALGDGLTGAHVDFICPSVELQN